MKLKRNFFLFVVQNLLFIGFFFQIGPPKIFAHAPDAIRTSGKLIITPTKITFQRSYLVNLLHLESVWQSLDTDNNQQISDQEIERFEGESPEFELIINNHDYTISKKIFGKPSYQDYFAGKDTSFSIGFESQAIILEPGSNKLIFAYKGQKDQSSLKSLAVEPDQLIAVIDKKVRQFDGLRLTLDYLQKPKTQEETAIIDAQEKSQEYSFPCDQWGQKALDLYEGKRESSWAKKLDLTQLSNWIVNRLEGDWQSLLFVFVVVTFFGSLHAFTPGHGKALTSAYLIGKEGRTKHIIFLGLTVTTTHTLLVYLLGFVSLFLKKSQASLALSQAAEFGSAILVIIISLIMLISKVKPILPHCFQHLLGIGHRHDHDHDHQGSHIHKKNDLSKAISLKELTALGISGGLVPCGDALLLMLLAVGAGKPVLGLALVFSFSLGMALTLIVLGFLIIKSKKLLARLEKFQTIQTILSFLSPIIILIIGIGLLLGLVNSF